MTLFSKQALRCCICGVSYEATCRDGTRWANGVCSMRCHYEKEWRYLLSVLGKAYRPDERTFDQHGYPVELNR